MQEDCITTEETVHDYPVLTCDIKEASQILNRSYDWVLSQSKVKNPEQRLPGFKVGKSSYCVIIAELPDWLRRKAGLE